MIITNLNENLRTDLIMKNITNLNLPMLELIMFKGGYDYEDCCCDGSCSCGCGHNRIELSDKMTTTELDELNSNISTKISILNPKELEFILFKGGYDYEDCCCDGSCSCGCGHNKIELNDKMTTVDLTEMNNVDQTTVLNIEEPIINFSGYNYESDKEFNDNLAASNWTISKADNRGGDTTDKGEEVNGTSDTSVGGNTTDKAKEEVNGDKDTSVGGKTTDKAKEEVKGGDDTSVSDNTTNKAEVKDTNDTVKKAEVNGGDTNEDSDSDDDSIKSITSEDIKRYLENNRKIREQAKEEWEKNNPGSDLYNRRVINSNNLDDLSMDNTIVHDLNNVVIENLILEQPDINIPLIVFRIGVIFLICMFIEVCNAFQALRINKKFSWKKNNNKSAPKGTASAQRRWADAPVSWGLYFQDAASPSFEGIVDLHNRIMFYLVVILFGVSWVLLSLITNFNNSSNKLVYRHLNHGKYVPIHKCSKFNNPVLAGTLILIFGLNLG